MSDPAAHGFQRAKPAYEPAGTSHKPLSGGVIAAIVVAVVAVVVLLGATAWCIRRWKKKRRARAAVPPPRAPAAAETAVVRTGSGTDDGERAQGQATSTSSQDTESSAEHIVDVEVEVCGICRHACEDGPPDVLECHHAFHRHCIRRWLDVNLACPVCNATNIKLTGDTGKLFSPFLLHYTPILFTL
jgi:hypothetical protein